MSSSKAECECRPGEPPTGPFQSPQLSGALSRGFLLASRRLGFFDVAVTTFSFAAFCAAKVAGVSFSACDLTGLVDLADLAVRLAALAFLPDLLADEALACLLVLASVLLLLAACTGKDNYPPASIASTRREITGRLNKVITHHRKGPQRILQTRVSQWFHFIANAPVFKKKPGQKSIKNNGIDTLSDATFKLSRQQRLCP